MSLFNGEIQFTGAHVALNGSSKLYDSESYSLLSKIPLLNTNGWLQQINAIGMFDNVGELLPFLPISHKFIIASPP